MAKRYNTTKSTAWNAALLDYTAASAAAFAILEHYTSPARGRIFDLLVETIEALLKVPAPGLGAFRTKLKAYWGESLFCEYERASQKQRIVGDIRRIEMWLVGIEEPEASGGMDRDKIDKDWSEASSVYERAVMEANNSGETAQPAEATLLSLPAPNIHAVLRKLELFWGSQRLSPMFGGAGPHELIRDLRRLALLHE